MATMYMHRSMITAMVFLIITNILINRGICENCSLDNINIGTVRSGREINGKAEWNVTVINTCENCGQSEIKLGCEGFQTAKPVDPATFLDQGHGQCLLINGSILNPKATVRFSYAWDPPFLFFPLHSRIPTSCNS
ncbi:hypothetical protein CsatB_008450 [Cannabis sativa]|uniref:Protein TAPETUM DETERMINANT 1-like n=2 Tax=Cannabis sativa TaxID=3483 RepID=A0AB40E9Y4_CANSA|nr:TPD1 protein homolog 1B [Cannabis sativa]KAF4373111.1 hypothetical protein F8388_019293 [Cannabis sativa]KAF4388341.1 hypothetical protein G4B88_013178 [Cannabis sativa]